MRLDRWQLIVLGWTALFVGIVTAVTIPDFPRDWPLWLSMTQDPNGYWHELWYILGAYLSGIAIILWASLIGTVKAFLRLWMREYE